MTGYNRRDFMKLLAASGLSLAVPSALTAEEAPLILKPIPSSGEKLPVIGLGTSRVFEVGPGELGAREVGLEQHGAAQPSAQQVGLAAPE